MAERIRNVFFILDAVSSGEKYVAGHGVAPVIDADVSVGNDVARIVHGVSTGYDVAAGVAEAILVGGVSQGACGEEADERQNDCLFHGEVFLLCLLLKNAVFSCTRFGMYQS